MPTESIKKLTDEFKSHREKREISLNLIHNKTRIDIKYLKAIEEGNFDVMPQVYLRAFIKEYAKSIELDPDETLKKYEMAIAGNYGVQESEEEKIEIKESKGEKKKLVYTSENLKGPDETSSKGNNNLLIGLSGAAAVIVILIIVSFFNNSSEPEIVKENPYENILEENVQRFDAPAEEITPVEKLDSLSLVIATIDTSWIRILVDGEGEQEYIMKPDREKEFKASNEFVLLTGNAGGLELYLDGEKLEFDNPKGAIRNFLINRNGIRKIESLPVNSQ